MEKKDYFDDKVELESVIVSTAEVALEMQTNSGAFPAGHNGVRFDPETPVRNTSHWMITLIKAFQITKDDKFKNGALSALGYLLSNDARPMEASFWHRSKPEKDFCNGLMGQAYTIEALAIAYNVFKIEEAKNVAEEVFLIHPFDEKTGLWQRVAVDGSYLTADFTFNHQLWFAAAGGILWSKAGNKEVLRRVRIFMDNLTKNMHVYSGFHKGLIIHPLLTNLSDSINVINQMKMIYTYINQMKKEKIRHAIGYHMFNMYAFSLLYNVFNEHKFWETSKFKMALNYINSIDYNKSIKSKEFCEPYSPAGFETSYAEKAYVMLSFNLLKEDDIFIKELIQKQFDKTYDFQMNLMNRITADQITQAARIYKLTRLPNIVIRKEIHDA